ncbi:hypothetical protein V7138_12355 [Bacillus sp. JJ1533]|uniref:hypothetical protein n=1 Tax=Bacillus sp. JJ1533 TaxID=3122959 RepID=UPI002FFE2D4E
MTENQKNNNSNKPVANKNLDLIKDLTSNLQKNVSSIDLNSLVKMAAPLLKNEAVMNSVLVVSKKKQSSDVNSAKSSNKKDSIKLTRLNEQLDRLGQELLEIKAQIVNGISEVSQSDELANIKSELIEIKSQNAYLTGIVEELYKYRK